MKRWLVVVLAAAGLAQAQDSMRAHFIDVGQGNAILLEFSCGAVLIDAGGRDEESDGRLYNYLDTFFGRHPNLNRTLDAVFITHTHIDHNRALRRLIEEHEPAITVKGYVHNGRLNGSGRFAAQFMADNAAGLGIANSEVKVSAIRSTSGTRGMSNAIIDPVACSGTDPEIRVLSGQMDIDPGWTEEALNNGNNHSLVIRVDFGEASFLFTGDLEEEGIEELLEFYGGTELLDVDVYQVGHHGSYNGITPELVAAMSPRVAVISMSKSTDRRDFTAWAYGHPREPAVDRLVAGVTRTRTPKQVRIATGTRKFKNYTMRKAVFGTGWDGTVVVVARSDGTLRVGTLGQ